MACLERCPECPERGKKPEDRKPIVPGRGPHDAKVVFVGEGPGREENNKKRCFQGKTGEEMTHVYVPAAGLSTDFVYLTNAFKCHWADASDTPPQSVIQSCANFHLRRELEELNPELVVLMGSTANSLVDDVDLNMHHGRPLWRNLLGTRRKIYPTYHPALGIHQSSAMMHLLQDFRDLKLLLANKLVVAIDEIEYPIYERLRTPAEVDDILAGMYDHPLSIDTESKRRHFGYIPWCTTFSVIPGQAWMIRDEDKVALDRFRAYTLLFRILVMHHASHDIGVLRRLLMLSEEEVMHMWDRVKDTMHYAYEIGNLPQGLKVLAYRLAGMKLNTFEETVKPYSLDHALEYLANTSEVSWPKPDPIPTGEYRERKCQRCNGRGAVKDKRRGMLIQCVTCWGEGIEKVEKMSHKWGMDQYLNRLIGDYLKEPTDVDVWKRWGNWDDEVKHPVIERFGHMPLPSIEYAPERVAINYACRDADATGRIFPILSRRKALVRRNVA